MILIRSLDRAAAVIERTAQRAAAAESGLATMA
jgi:hypothetical protein